MAGVKKQKATNDTAALGVGLIVFWPALFLIKGNVSYRGRIARLKGEMEALGKISIQKKCDISFRQTKVWDSKIWPDVHSVV